MIIGNGLIAAGFSSYSERNDVLIFASGVANSRETSSDAFRREEMLLRRTLHDHESKAIVYFGTCSVFDPALRSNPYVRHKLNMEKIVSQNSKNHYLFRLPQVFGEHSNNHTIIRNFCDKIKTGKELTVFRGAIRYLIDLHDVVKICEFLIENKLFQNKPVEITLDNPLTAIEIAKMCEEALGKQALITMIEGGWHYTIEHEPLKEIIENLGIAWNRAKAIQKIREYYG